MRRRRSACLRSAFFLPLALGAITLPATARTMDAGVRLFARTDGWYILKSASGCSAETRTSNDYLTLRLKGGLGYVTLANGAMAIPPGKYPIGFRIGPPYAFTGTVEAVVAPGAPSTVNVAFTQDAFVRVVNASWVELTLGDHKHLVNTQKGMDAIRTMSVCNISRRDPFARAGGGTPP